VQARLRPAPQWELVLQLWLFQGVTRNNIGGTLSALNGRMLGWEANLTAKYFVSRNVLVQGGVALTTDLSGVCNAIPAPAEWWFSAMTMVRVSF
jgi:hypothetical protein